MLSSVIFCLCGCCCLRCCQKHRSRQSTGKWSQKNSQKIVPSPQMKRPKPPRPPPPIYEYVPSTRPSGKVKEQNIEMKSSKSEEQCLDIMLEVNKTKEDLDMKWTLNEGHNLSEMKSNKNSEQDLEMKENIAYCQTRKNCTSST